MTAKIKYASIDDFYLDPQNPRLGRHFISTYQEQEKILHAMRGWTLDELAVSFLESGYWPQEALIVVKEEHDDHERLVVVEGNRRLAALLYLYQSFTNEPPSTKWAAIIRGQDFPKELFEQIPYIEVENRDEVKAFLGFRHVTGIKQWDPAEKAEYISSLVDGGMTYDEVMRKIGSKTPTVRQNYVAYKIFRQMEELEDVSIEHVEEKFSVLYLSLKEKGIRDFLNISLMADPEEAQRPVNEENYENLKDFSEWLFGTEKKPALFTDSRNVSKFSKILQSPEAVEYLREEEYPDFSIAIRKAGADEPDLIERIKKATTEIEQSLSVIHLYKDSEGVSKAMRRFSKSASELMSKYPELIEEICASRKEGD